jgi:hypothetical protein
MTRAHLPTLIPRATQLPPALLLLPQFCLSTPPIRSFEPILVYQRVLTITSLLRTIPDHKGHPHGGLNE